VTEKNRRGIWIGVLASLAFGTSGAFIKPLLESGWSPAAAVTVRTGIAGLALAPFAFRALRGRWGALWVGRGRILAMAAIGVAGTQLAYFMAIQRMNVGMAILIEYLAPLLLVGFAWATTRRMPRVVVLIGSVVALTGLVLVIGPANGQRPDALGLIAAFGAAIGAATYYLIAARPAVGLPPVALAACGLLLGSVLLASAGLAGALPFETNFGEVPLLGGLAPWWVPLGVVALVGTAVAYAASIAATGMLGSRLMSFIGLLEVVFAALFAWLLLGEVLGPLQFLGGALILAGIIFVDSERSTPPVAPIPPSQPVFDEGVTPRG